MGASRQARERASRPRPTVLESSQAFKANRLGCWALLIRGRVDRILPLDMAFILLKRIPKADIHIFSNCGHWAQCERANAFDELVGNFLKPDDKTKNSATDSPQCVAQPRPTAGPVMSTMTI